MNLKELDPIYTHTVTKQQGPTAALSMMAALAITLATAGSMGHVGSMLATQASLTGASATVVQGMTAATLTSLCVSAGNSVLNNTHNPTKAFQDFLSDKTWVGALKAGSIGGATAGLGSVFGVPQDAATMTDRALKAGVQTVATTGVHGVFGDSPEDALKAGLRTGVVAVVQGTLAHKIGDLKADEVVDPVTGLALHGLAGGFGGVILGGRDGMLPGAVGAMVGEGVAEYRDDATLGKLTGALSGAVVDLAQGGDGTKGLAVATLTASTAVEENYLRHRTCAVPKVDEEAEAEPDDDYHFRPNSPRTTYALEEMERFEGASKALTALDQERRRQAGITKKSVFDSAYEFKQRELADSFIAKDAADLTPYEARVLHDYRTGAFIGLALEVTPLALPAVGRAVTRVVVSTKGVVNAAGKLKYSAVKRAMSKSSIDVDQYLFKSLSGKITETPVMWTSPTGTKQTYKVWQRTDIDWGRVRTKGSPEFIGKTNAQAAKAGMAPQLPNGHFATLHHIGQDSRGALVEASTHLHSFKSVKLPNGKKPFDVLHSSHGSKMKHPEFPVNHDLFKLETKEYWRGRVGAHG